jgi:prepilin-type N-terminal cleavage/methylation domain-containing protein
LKKINLLNDKGFTLVEMMVAAAIMVVVVFGGFQAYLFFNTQTNKEAKKMDDISEFNALSKDLLSFTEGAGISTFYLNFPIKTKGCNDSEPCVRELVGQNFVTPTTPLPSILSGMDCMQFYKDAKGKPESKLAYPGKPYMDKIWESKDIELGLTQELYATWILKDSTSPPFMMVKSRDTSIFLSQLSGRVRAGINLTSDIGLAHAFYESNTLKENMLKLVGYPFLMYNTVQTGQYMIQYAHEVVACADDPNRCINLMKKVSSATNWSNADVSLAVDADFPAKVYAIEFRPLDFTTPFFKEIFDRQQLATNCLTSWGEGKQANAGFFFPSATPSVSSPSTDPAASMNIAVAPQNPLYLPKYTYDRMGESDKGMWVTLPIDIVTYRIEAIEGKPDFRLASELWHHTDIKKKIKIHQLKAPFVLTRKLGSPEMGIWYNPIKKSSP